MDKVTLLKLAFEHVKENCRDLGGGPQFDLHKGIGPDAYGGDDEALAVLRAFENYQSAGYDLLEAIAVLGRKYGLRLNPR
jgi:hypothetical protein